MNPNQQLVFKTLSSPSRNARYDLTEADYLARKSIHDNDFLFHDISAALCERERSVHLFVNEVIGSDALYDGIRFDSSKGGDAHPYFIDQYGYVVTSSRVDMDAIARLKLTRNSQGAPHFSLIKNKDEIEALIAKEREEVLVYAARIAQALGMVDVAAPSYRVLMTKHRVTDAAKKQTKPTLSTFSYCP